MRDMEMDNEVKGEAMSSIDLDHKIHSFLDRKHAEFPELATAGRHGSRTVKYALGLRGSGQILFTR